MMNYVTKKIFNNKAIRNNLTIRYDPTEKTALPAIKWSDLVPSYSDPEGKHTENLLKEGLREMLYDNKGSYSISLSGGIDSTLVLSILRNLFPDKKIIAICAVFEQSLNENLIAEQNSNRFNASLKILPIQSIFVHLPKLVSITNKPRWNTYQHFVAEESKKFGNILVTGDSADELFGGYIFRYKKFQRLHRRGDSWKTRTINYLECHNRDWVPDQESMFGSAIKFNWEEIYQFLKLYFLNKLSPLKQVMLADFNGKLLHDFLPTNNSIAKKYRIKIHSPFLYPKLVKFALKLPFEQNCDIQNDKGKLILRKICKRHKVIHFEEKRGFSPDLLIDWQKNGREIFCAQMLHKNNYIYKHKLINYNWVLRAFERVENDLDIRYLNRLISILALEVWLKIFVTKELKPTTTL